MSDPKTLFDKIWQNHLVEVQDDGTCLLYIDRHLVHEVTSPQAFEGLANAGRKVRRPDLTLAVPDHNVPTAPRRASKAKKAVSKLRLYKKTVKTSAFLCLICKTSAKALSTSLGQSKASRFRAQQPYAAIATRQLTALLGR